MVTLGAFRIRLWGVAEKCGLPSYSEHSSAWKMAASIGGRHLQLKEKLWLAELVSIFRGAFCLLFLHSEVGAASEVPRWQTLNADWAKSHRRVDSETYPECSPYLALGLRIMFRIMWQCGIFYQGASWTVSQWLQHYSYHNYAITSNNASPHNMMSVTYIV